jgi:hypothetical protein
MLFGSLLGDGYLNFRFQDKKVQGNIRFCEEHCMEQNDYLKHKGVVLKNHLKSVTNRTRYDKRFKKETYQMCTLRSAANPEFKMFYNMFYNEKTKIVPDDLSLLTPRAIAYWFMDDGGSTGGKWASYKIHTNGFVKNDTIKLKKELQETYGIYTTIHKSGALYFLSKTKHDLNRLIKPYIVDSMKYKLI